MFYHIERDEKKIISILNALTGCVPPTISFHLYFLRISKVSSMLHHGSVGQVQSKEYYFKFIYTFVTFLLLFFIKKLCFIIFISFKFKFKFLQQNINQSETGTDEKKLSVQGGLNKKEIQLNLCNIFSIFIFNEFYLFV